MKSILKELSLCPFTAKEYESAATSETSSENNKDELKWILIPMASSKGGENLQNESFGDHDNMQNESSTATHYPTPSDKGTTNNGAMKKEKSHHMSNCKQFSDLQSSHLGSKLANALTRILKFHPDQPVAFVGMDSPELPIDEIHHAVKFVSQAPQKAYMNPAQDGGYGMLCIPPCATNRIFEGVRWSSSLTAVSQMKALSDNGIDTVLGSLMNDIDEVDDLINLAKRLIMLHSKSDHLSQTGRSEECNEDELTKDSKLDRLTHCSGVLHNRMGSDKHFTYYDTFRKVCPCPITFLTLLTLEVVKQTSSGGYVLCIGDNY